MVAQLLSGLFLKIKAMCSLYKLRVFGVGFGFDVLGNSEEKENYSYFAKMFQNLLLCIKVKGF